MALLPYIHSSSLWYIQFSQGVNANTRIYYLFRHSCSHFCCRVRQGKRLSVFLQKNTDSWTQTTHLVGYNILVLKYVKISAGRLLLSIEAIRELTQKSCSSRLIYTKLSSHRSFVINMYVITMAWRCISPWSFHRSPQTRREMDIFRYIGRFPRILK